MLLCIEYKKEIFENANSNLIFYPFTNMLVYNDTRLMQEY